MNLKTLSGTVKLPAFFPDATSGVVKGVDSTDLKNCKMPGIVVNTYHILRRSMVKTITDLGGIHKYMNWSGPIISDSGGFQAMSLIRANKKLGTIHKDKIIFRLENKKIILTPEKCIQIQLQLGSDIVMCLDDCTRPEDSLEEQEKSVERTISWARKCKAEFDKHKKNALIFGIIQGGNNKELRKYCAEELLKCGFDGYGFGGWPIDEKGNLVTDILKLTAKLMLDNLPKYAMGVGKPENIVTCSKIGYNLFDCVLPTRDARRKRLYILKNDPNKKDFYEHIYLQDKKHFKDPNPVSKTCDCHCCKNYSRAYLYNLFKLEDPLAIRLATIHNLRFYSRLMEYLRN
jgi:queuine tRNA-ribosyltransferase